MEQNKSKEKLFAEFPPVSKEQWEQKLKVDLKGADYEKKLVWKTREGFDMQPYYCSEDMDNVDYLDVFPGDFPYTRGIRPEGNNWYIRQDIRVKDLKRANEKSLDILMKGVDSLGFIMDEDKEYSKDDLDLLLKNIFAEIVEINFECGLNALSLMENHYEMLKKYNRDFQKIQGSVCFDPFGRLALSGNYFKSKEEDLETCSKLIRLAEFLPNFRVISVRGDYFHNSGATIVEELALALSAGTEYLTQLTEKGLSVNQIAPKIKFTFSVGTDYFMEIAKFRAARLLWGQIVKEFGPSKDEVAKMNVHAVTSKWNMAVYDPYVNLLRSTTEAMSGIIAGIDSLTVMPFNSAYEDPSAFSERIARNQQLLLKEEASLDKVADMGAGSYYIEQLTDSIAEAAWKLFLEVESQGAYLQALQSGFIQNKIKASAQKRDMDIAIRKEVFIGVNQYPDFNEVKTNELAEIIFSKEPAQKEGKLVEPILPYRGPQAFESLRYMTDRYSVKNKRPLAFMLTYGNQAMRIARSQFSRNFFACAGFEVQDNPGFNTIEEGVEAALKSKAEIVVVCSSDEEYPLIVPEIYKQLKDQAIVVIAGYPKDSIEELKAAGIEYFIHMRSNVLENLEQISQKLGIL